MQTGIYILAMPHRNDRERKQHWPRGSRYGRNSVSCWLSVSENTCLSADQKAALPVLLMIFSSCLPQGGLSVLAMQSVFEESLPRPSVDAVRGEMMPSCWILQPVRRGGQEVTRVIYLLQVRYDSWQAGLYVNSVCCVCLTLLFCKLIIIFFSRWT